MSLRYEVIESRHWLHVSGRKASLYGAVPYTSNADCTNWSVVSVGWTVRNPITGEVGMCRTPFATRGEAEAFALRLGRPSPYGIGS